MIYNKIFIWPDHKVQFFIDYCDFNDIEYTSVDLWCQDDCSFIIDASLKYTKNACLILATDYIHEIYQSDKCKKTVLSFLDHNTIIFSKNTGDSCFEFFNPDLKKCLIELDSIIPYRSLQIVLDCTMLENNWLKHLKNIHVIDYPTITDVLSPPERIRGACVEKKHCKYDFLLTSVIKSGRIHRFLLKKEIESRPKILNRGYINFNNRNKSDNCNNKNWKGDFPKYKSYHGWVDCHPSMDLYKNCWLEVIPETLYDDFHYLTEKTTKAFITKTPFLVLATCGYLEFLRSIGFKTFSPFIDESYDSEPNLEKRTRLLVDSLEKIVFSGAENCYNQVQEILNHNYARYAELSGRLLHDKDNFAKSFFIETQYEIQNTQT